MQAEDWAVVDFQFSTGIDRPFRLTIALVLNITPNHLDRHKTMQAYTAAKAHILLHQMKMISPSSNRDDPGSLSLAGQVRGRLSLWI